MKNQRRRALVAGAACSALLLATVVWLTACSRPETPSQVTYLVDMSKSFGRLTPDDVHGLRVLTNVISEVAVNEWYPPVTFMWGPITGASAAAPSICGPAIEFSPTLLRDREDDTRGQKKELLAWHEACIERLAGGALPLSQKTDISGAIRLTTETTTELRGWNVVIILSDFDEDLPGDGPPISFSLRDSLVILLYRPACIGEKDYAGVFERASEWKDRLEAAQARKVCTLPIRGLSRQSVRACIGGQLENSDSES